MDTKKSHSLWESNLTASFYNSCNMLMTAYQKHSISFLSCKDKDECVNYGGKKKKVFGAVLLLPAQSARAEELPF